MLDAIAEAKVTTICAPPTVWRMFVQEDMANWKMSLREVCSAGEPLNPEIIEHVQKVWGLTVREGLRPDRNHVQIGVLPRRGVEPGSMGQEAPGYRIRLLDVDDKDVEEGEVCIDLDPAPIGLMRGYQNDDGSSRHSALLRIVPATWRHAIPTATTFTSVALMMCSRRRTIASVRSSWRAR